MKAPTQIQPLENWQDFETLCKKLWGEIWHCADAIKKNGCSGKNQNGIKITNIGFTVLSNSVSLTTKSTMKENYFF